MNPSDERVPDLVKRALGPVADAGLKGDLWPRMRARMDRPAIRLPWWDWALAAAVLLCLILFPAAIPAVLYQF
jgi:type VI protein secretion system component VasF